MSHYDSPEGKKNATDSAGSDDEVDTFASPTSVTSESSQKSPYAISFAGMSKVSDEDVTPFPSAFEREEADARGGDVTIHFKCSDGSKYIQQFAIGQTVQVLKAWLDSEKGIPYANQMLYLGDDSGGKVMIDPLSLNDFSGISVDKDVEIFVEISGGKK